MKSKLANPKKQKRTGGPERRTSLEDLEKKARKRVEDSPLKKAQRMAKP
jgi:hypothetical protein